MKYTFLLFGLLLLSFSASATGLFPSRTDFRDESIYFVLTTRFFDGDSTNNVHCWDGNNPGDPAWRGDFKGLIEKMDYIKALGFTAIWMTPIVENASGYDYHGYHAHDFSKVDYRLESEGVGFQQVIDAAHARGMKIILDIVLNHTGNFGEANLCKLFLKNTLADQSDIDACMVPYTQSQGGLLPDNYASLPSGSQYAARLSKMKNSSDENGQRHNYDSHNYWHHYANFNWDETNRWWGQIAGDCVDLNTENPAVYNYLLRCYSKFIRMGVDGFRIDTGGHIARLTFNKAFIPAFHAAAADPVAVAKRGGTPFYMFAEVCARYSSICYREHQNLSPFYYTWAENTDYAWDTDSCSWDNIVAYEGDACNTHTNHRSCQLQATNDYGNLSSVRRISQNALLNDNTYHEPDYSEASGLNVIDFTLHHNFETAGNAWNIAQPGNDKYYNDATWNVVYVDSHDYAPNGAPEDKRYSKSQANWAENLDLMFTHRGIPCLYYGSEIEFKKGMVIDNGPNTPLIQTGRAYFGGYIKGDIQVSDFAEYTGASGNLQQTLSHPLAMHIQRLNRIRQAVPALRKGQYSVSNISKSGVAAFKRRYTDSSTDSYALVCISGGATFSQIENGTYVDCITGESRTVTNNSLSISCSGKGNMRVYVLSTSLTPAPGKIGNDGKYLYATVPADTPNPSWDGTEEALTNDPTSPTDPVQPIEPCLNDADERCVFFTKSSDFGNSIYCYIWHKTTGSTTQVCGSWPGKKATHLGNGQYKFHVPDEAGEIDGTWKIIWNDGSGNQTADLAFHNQGLYSGSNKGSIAFTTDVTTICEEPTATIQVAAKTESAVQKQIENGHVVIIRDGKKYSVLGQILR